MKAKADLTGVTERIDSALTNLRAMHVEQAKQWRQLFELAGQARQAAKMGNVAEARRLLKRAASVQRDVVEGSEEFAWSFGYLEGDLSESRRTGIPVSQLENERLERDGWNE